MPIVRNQPAEYPRVPEDIDLEQLLRDVERMYTGLEAIGGVVLELDARALLAIDGHVRRG